MRSTKIWSQQVRLAQIDRRQYLYITSYLNVKICALFPVIHSHVSSKIEEKVAHDIQDILHIWVESSIRPLMSATLLASSAEAAAVDLASLTFPSLSFS